MGSPIQALKIDTNIIAVREEFDKLISHINESLSKPFNLDININSIQNQMQQVTQQVNQASKQMENNVADSFSNRIQTDSEKLAKAVEQAQRSLSISLQGLQTKYGSLLPKDEITTLQNSINNLNGTDLSSLRSNTKDLRLDMSQMTADAKASSAALRTSNQDAKSFGATFLSDSAKFAIWMSVATLIMQPIQATGKAIQSIVELDKTLSTLSITMNTTKQGLADITKEMQQTAIATGSDVSAVASAVKIYANMGETAQSSLAKAKSSIMLSNVTGLNTSEVVDSIHGIINEYNLAGQNAETTSTHIADSLVAISKNMAMDFGKGISEITKGIELIGTISNTTGKMSAEQTEALLGSVIERTRLQGEQVANGIKTTMARLYSSKDISPDVTDEELSATSKMLKELNINTLNADKSFRPFLQILQDIKDKTASMTDSQRQAILVQMSGQRQANILANAIDTIGKTTELTNKAMSSNGELMDANSKYMDTISAKTKTLGSEITTMFQQGINTNVIKGILDDVIKLVSTFGNLHTVVALVGTALAIFKGEEILSFFVKLPNMIRSAIGSMEVFKVTIGAIQLQQEGLITTNEIASLSFTALGNSIKASFLSNPLGWIALGITAVVVAVDAFNTSAQKTIDKLNEVSSKIQQEQSDISNLKSQLSTLDELHSKTILTNDDKTKLKQINDDLMSKYPELISYYNSEAGAFEVSTDKLKELIKKKQELAMIENANNLQAAKDSSDKAQKAIDDANAKLKENTLTKAFGTSGGTLNIGGAGTANMQMSSSERQKLIDEISKNQSLVDKSNQVINQSTKFINDYINEQTKAGQTNATVNEGLIALGYSQSQIDDAISKSTNATKDNTKAKSDNANASFDMGTAEQTLAKSISDAKGNISELNKALSDHAKNGKYSSDAILDLCSKYPSLLQYLGSDADITKELTRLKGEEVNKVTGSLNTQITAEANYINNLASDYSIDLQNWGSMQQAKLEISNQFAQKLSAINEQIIASQNAMTSSLNVDDWQLAAHQKLALIQARAGLQSTYNAIDTSIGVYYNLKSASANLSSGLNDYGLGGSSSGSSGSGSTDPRVAAEQSADQAIQTLRTHLYEAIKKQIEDQKKQELDSINDRLNAETNLYQTRIKGLQDQIKALQDTKNDDQTQLDSLNKDAQNWSRDTSQEGIKREQDIQKLIKDLKKKMQIDSLNDQIQVQQDAETAMKDSYKKQIDDANTKYDNLLKDSNIYATTDQMIQSKNQQAILDLIESYAPKYDSIGHILGSSMAQAMIDEVKKGLDGLTALQTGNLSGFMKTGEDKTGIASSGSGSGSSGSGSTGVRVTSTLRIGSSGEQVKTLQSALGGLVVDGIFGNQTFAKLEEYQRSHNLAIDGIFGNNSRRSLLGYEKGGLADYTGLAMLHGTKGKPERILDASVTKTFDDLVYSILPKFTQLKLPDFNLRQQPQVINNYNEPIVKNDITNNNDSQWKMDNGMDNLNRMIKNTLNIQGHNANFAV